jgi:hypothetical protein
MGSGNEISCFITWPIYLSIYLIVTTYPPPLPSTSGHPIPFCALPSHPIPSQAIPCLPVPSHHISTHPMPTSRQAEPSTTHREALFPLFPLDAAKLAGGRTQRMVAGSGWADEQKERVRSWEREHAGGDEGLVDGEMGEGSVGGARLTAGCRLSSVVYLSTTPQQA